MLILLIFYDKICISLNLFTSRKVCCFMRFNFRYLLTGLCITCVMSFTPKADAAYVFVFDRAVEPENAVHYITDDDIREEFLTKTCKIGDFVVLIDWSSFVFVNENWGFIERGISALTDGEWKKIEEVLNVKDAKDSAIKEDWLILEAVSTKK